MWRKHVKADAFAKLIMRRDHTGEHVCKLDVQTVPAVEGMVMQAGVDVFFEQELDLQVFRQAIATLLFQ